MTKIRRKKHKPVEIVAKLRNADAMLNAGKELALVLAQLPLKPENCASACAFFASRTLLIAAVIEGLCSCLTSQTISP